MANPGRCQTGCPTTAKVIDGEPLDEREGAIFAELSGGRRPPSAPTSEFWFIKGRRVAGTQLAAALCVYTAAFGDHVGTVRPVIAGVVRNLASPTGLAIDYQPVFQGIWRSDRRAA
jgi:hypothetical protein